MDEDPPFRLWHLAGSHQGHPLVLPVEGMAVCGRLREVPEDALTLLDRYEEARGAVLLYLRREVAAGLDIRWKRPALGTAGGRVCPGGESAPRLVPALARELAIWYLGEPRRAGQNLVVGRRPSGVSSATCGAAMRAAPLGLLYARDEARLVAAVAVAAGADTDSVAAMDGAMAGAYNGACSLPTTWYDGLEGKEIEEVSRDLWELAEKS